MILKRVIYTNASEYPGTWYWSDRSWAAKTVSVAADRLTLLSPSAIQVDVGGKPMEQSSETEHVISADAAWDFGQSIGVHAVDTAYTLGQFVRPATPNNYVYVCTTAGTSNLSAPTFGTTVGGTTTDGTNLVWTCYKDDTIAANRAGQDYYIYDVWPTAGSTPKHIISKNATVPHGYDATNSRKVGGFHCLCASMSTPGTRANSTAYALGKTILSGSYWYRCSTAGTSASSPPTLGTTIGGTTTDGTVVWVCESIHPASGYLTGDIIPNSVWDLRFRSESGNNQGMAYVAKDGLWEFIYPASNDGGKAASVFNVTPWHTVNWMDAVDAVANAGVRLMRDAQFQNGAYGSNEKTNIAGSTGPLATGGHVDTAERRMISHSFLEDCCGHVWQWLDEQSTKWDFSTAWGNYVLPGNKGSLYNGAGTAGTGDVKLVAGGYWVHGTACGSRARAANFFRWSSSSAIGFRGVARSLTK